MVLLGCNDLKNYNINDKLIMRNSARAIIVKNNKLYLSFSKKLNIYKLPGGGVEANESLIDCLVRETSEEVGATIIKDSIKEFGYFYDKWQSTKKTEKNMIWYNKSYYYICDIENELHDLKPTPSEINDEFQRTIIAIDDLNKIIEINSLSNDSYIYRENYIFKKIFDYYKK